MLSVVAAGSAVDLSSSSSSLSTWHHALAVGVANAVGGALFGASIGFVPVYTTLVSLSQNCTAFSGSLAACWSVGGGPHSSTSSGNYRASCQWVGNETTVNDGNGTTASPVRCVFPGGAAANCAWRRNHSECRGGGGAAAATATLCEWVTPGDYCRNRIGFSPLDSGLFSGAMIFGAMVGSLLMSMLGQRFRIEGPKAFLVAGAVACGGCLAVHLSAIFDDPVAATPFALLLVGRVVLGIAIAVACVACPMYVERHAPVPRLRRPLGVLFQVFSTVLVAAIAVMGILIAPPSGNDGVVSVAVYFRFRFQILCGLVSLLSVLMLVLGVVKTSYCAKNVVTVSAVVEATRNEGTPLLLGENDTPAPSVVAATRQQQAITDGDDAVEDVAINTVDDVQPFAAASGTCGTSRGAQRVLLCRLVAVGIVMSFAQQLTGINAVVNYAPRIAERMGFTPMLGNVVVMSWKTLVTLCSIPVSAVCSMRHMFLWGTAMASIGCALAAVGIDADILPTEAARTATAACGIGLFVVAFEVGMGGSFYVLSQQLFPVALRSIGSSITLLSQFAFNILVNVVFPVAVAALSPQGGDDDRGMSVVFFFFAACGVVSLGCLIPNLHPFYRP